MARMIQVEVSDEVFNAFQTICEQDGVRESEAFRKCVSTEVFVRDEVLKGNELLVFTPNFTPKTSIYSKFVFELGERLTDGDNA